MNETECISVAIKTKFTSLSELHPAYCRFYVTQYGMMYEAVKDVAETLKETNRLLIDTMDEVLNVQQAGRDKRRAAEAELFAIEGELRAKILETRE